MQEKAVPVEGGCLCGKIRYYAQVFLKSGYYCHCSICQKASGHGGEVGVPVLTGTLRFTRGQPKYFQSSDMGERGFCSECGAKILWKATTKELEWATNVNAGSLDDRALVQLTRHIYVDTKLPWNRASDNVPAFKEIEMDSVMEAWKKERGA